MTGLVAGPTGRCVARHTTVGASATLKAVDVVQTLLSTYVFGDLSPAALAPVAQHARARQYQPGEFVCRVGDTADTLLVVASGQLKESLVTIEGEELIFEVFTPGAVFGEPGLFAPERNRIIDVTAMTPSTVLAIPRDTVIDFALAHPPVILRLLEGLAATVRSMTEEAGLMAYRPIRERLVAKLLELAETHGHPAPDGVKIVVNLPQSTLAAMIGASRENVNRALATLAAEGVLDTSGGRVTNVKPDALRARATSGTSLYRRNRLLAMPPGRGRPRA